jgi:NTP pyrophosphatase (non-canonical NTP hydrolase)
MEFFISSKELKSKLQEHEFKQALGDELVDVFVYLLRLSDVCKIDLQEHFQKKMQQNAEKYPVELAKGSAEKYTAYEKGKA